MVSDAGLLSFLPPALTPEAILPAATPPPAPTAAPVSSSVGYRQPSLPLPAPTAAPGATPGPLSQQPAPRASDDYAFGEEFYRVHGRRPTEFDKEMADATPRLTQQLGRPPRRDELLAAAMSRFEVTDAPPEQFTTAGQ